MISLGASIGAAFGIASPASASACGGAAAVAAAAEAAAAAAAPTNAIIVGGVGSTSVAISGMMMTAANEHDVRQDRQRHRVPRSAIPTLIDGFDDVAEHVTRHGSVLPGSDSLIGVPVQDREL